MTDAEVLRWAHTRLIANNESPESDEMLDLLDIAGRFEAYEELRKVFQQAEDELAKAKERVVEHE